MKRSFVLLAAAFLLLLGGAGLWLNAAPFDRRVAVPPVALQSTSTPTIGPVSASPSLIAVNTPTPILVTTQITDSRLIIESVNLFRINASGNPTLLGVMKDDGKNGDNAAGDKTYSLMVNTTETNSGRVQLRVTAAFRGSLRRATGESFVEVWNRLVGSGTYFDGAGLLYPHMWNVTVLASDPQKPTLYLAPHSEEFSGESITLERSFGSVQSVLAELNGEMTLLSSTSLAGDARVWSKFIHQESHSGQIFITVVMESHGAVISLSAKDVAANEDVILSIAHHLRP